jgi:nucleoside 2-deoxyribosyltransferase
MKLIYIAGPYTGKDRIEVEQNILNARRAMCRLIEQGWAVICPHGNSAHLDQYPPEYWYAADIEMLKRCDAVFVLTGYSNSKGTLNEILIASAGNIPIFYESMGVPLINNGPGSGDDRLTKIVLANLERVKA